VPGESKGKEYSPALFEEAVLFTPVAASETVTFALATELPGRIGDAVNLSAALGERGPQREAQKKGEQGSIIYSNDGSGN
jgi:hypothetical protein